MSQADSLFEAPEPVSAVQFVRSDHNELAPTALCHGHGPSSAHKPGERSPDLSFDPFTINPDLGSGSNVALHVRPEILIPRSQLPLYCLDLCNPCTSLPPCRSFSGYIQALENGDRSQSGIAVLIVRINGSDSLYAIERVYERVYTLCKLQSWTNLSQITGARRTTVTTSMIAGDSFKAGQGQWWNDVLWHDVSQRPTKKVKTSRAVDAIHQWAPDPTAPEIDTQISISSPPSERLLNPEDIRNAKCSKNDVLSMVDDAHANIVQQYLESLYLSKAPLTYFAKGPLSRARAKVPPDADHNHEYKLALAGRLRSMVSSINLIDKKYKDTLPEVIRSLSKASVARPDGDGKSMPAPRKWGKPKKMKLGKDGLISTEKDYVSQWWTFNLSDNAAFSSANDIDTSIKRQLAPLRFRDNLLQMILCLEVLALEGLANGSETLGAQTKKAGYGYGEMQETKKRPLARKTKDLKGYLDVLIDRLCIWQSTNLNDPMNTEKDGVLPEAKSDSQVEPGASTDRLKEFCVDVVGPFYGGRLPDLVEELGRTLGVKLGPSPSKRSLGQNVMKPDDPIPGTEAQRKIPPNIAKQAKRAANGKSSKPRVATLVRSSTDPLLQVIKRERSSTPQLPIPLKSDRKPFSRTSSMSQSRSFTQREVDFSAINKYNESKLKKKETVVKELQEAITVLKKPNRLSAVNDYFSEKERRKSLPPPKYTTKLHRRSTLDVQVGATPKRGVKTIAKSRDIPETEVATVASQDFVLPSTSSNVPQSVPRSQTSKAVPDSAARTDTVDHGSNRPPVFETPSKPSRCSNPLLGAGEESFGSSPVQDSPYGIPHAGDNTSPALRALKESTNNNFPKLFPIPTNRRSTSGIGAKAACADSPVSIQRVSGDQSNVGKFSETKEDCSGPRRVDQSIYDKLGWTEDDMDEIL